MKFYRILALCLALCSTTACVPYGYYGRGGYGHRHYHGYHSYHYYHGYRSGYR